MLTKQEQEILYNAPDGAEYYGIGAELVAYYMNVKNYNYLWRNAGAKEWYVRNGKPQLELFNISDLRKKQGKTVVDAVNELNAVCLYEYVNYYIYGECFFITNSSELLDNYYRVCTIEEFNQCVKEMSRGKSEFDYQIYLQEKTPLEPQKETKMSEEKPRMKVEYMFIPTSQNAYWFNDTEEELFTSPSEESKPVTLQEYINNVDDGDNGLYRKVETEIKTEKRWFAYNSKANMMQTSGHKTKGDCYNTLQGNRFRDDFQYIEITVEV